MIEWGKASEFAEKKFRRSKSLHTKKYYEVGVRRFRKYCGEKGVSEVDEDSVYGILDGFVGWLDARGIKPKTLTGYTSTPPRSSFSSWMSGLTRSASGRRWSSPGY